jgi:hypothetical protein
MEIATEPGRILHIDLQSIEPTGLAGYNHAVIIIDEYTRYRWVILLQGIREASNEFIAFFKALFSSIGRYPPFVQFHDNRGFLRFTLGRKRKDISIEPIKQYSTQNGLQGDCIIHAAQVMIDDAGLPPYLWPLAIEAAIYM